MLLEENHESVVIIADGAAFGPEIDKIMKIAEKNPSIYLYLPETFEWLILMSGCVNDKEIRTMSEDWGEHIESKQYFSWEQFFSEFLTQKTYQ